MYIFSKSSGLSSELAVCIVAAPAGILLQGEESEEGGTGVPSGEAPRRLEASFSLQTCSKHHPQNPPEKYFPEEC